MRFQCHIGPGVQAPPPAVIQAAAPHARRATRSSAKRRKLRGYTAVASGALMAMAGCASLDSKVVKAWAVEPVLSVVHSAQSSQAYYAMGRYFDGSQAWDKAINAYRKAIAADAQNIEAYNALGVALAQTGRFADAETTFRQAVALAPGLAHVRSNLGYVLMLAGKPGEAVTELKAAVKQDGSNAMARANLHDALARSDTLQYGATTAAAMSKSTEAVASAEEPDAALAARKVAAGLQVSEGTPTMISVPTPLTTAEIPTPLAASVSVPVALQTASVWAPQVIATVAPVARTAVATTTAPLTLRVIDKPTVPSLVERVTSAGGAPPAPATNPRISPKAFPVTQEHAMRLEVSNGNGVTGMAARVGRWLAARGMPADRLSNQSRFAQQQTVVQFRNGHEEAALRIARSLPANAKAEPMPTQGLRCDVRVVLGRDWVQTAACLDHNTCQPMMGNTEVAANR